jgi:hypothetical protein
VLGAALVQWILFELVQLISHTDVMQRKHNSEVLRVLYLWDHDYSDDKSIG